MQIEIINDDHSCPNCYYEWFDDKAYPCSRCIHNKPSEDMFRPKLRAEQTEPNSSEKPNNCEPKICDACRYYNSNIPCGSTPSACKEADKFAEEFVDGLKKLKPQTERSE